MIFRTTSRKRGLRTQAEDRRRYRVYWEPRLTRTAWLVLILASLFGCWMLAQLIELLFPGCCSLLARLAK